MPQFDIKLYTKVYFRLNSLYKWGSGWNMTEEQNAEYHKDCFAICELIGLKPYYSNHHNSCVKGVNKDAEYLYFHPMDISGTILKSNLRDYEQIIKQYSSKYFSLRETDTFAIEENLPPNRCGYTDNPNIIYEQQYLKICKIP